MMDSIKNVVVLTVIAVVAAGALSQVNKMTEARITENRFKVVKESLATILPAHDNDPVADRQKVGKVDYYVAKSGGEVVAYAFKSSSKKGYSGEVEILVVCDPEGTLIALAPVKHAETFDAINDPKLYAEFPGKNLKNAYIEVKKDGGDITHISGATMSCRAVSLAARDGLVAFSQDILGVTIDMADLVPAPKVEVPGPSVEITKDHIAACLSGYDNDPLADAVEVGGLKYYVAKQGGNVTGYAVFGSSEEGFGGKVELLVGISPEAQVQGVVVLAHGETAGYGKEAFDSKEYWQGFAGKGLGANWAVTVDGGDFEKIVGSESGATMSSRAAVGGIKSALDDFTDKLEDIQAK